jgi:hypothetical protein
MLVLFLISATFAAVDLNCTTGLRGSLTSFFFSSDDINGILTDCISKHPNLIQSISLSDQKGISIGPSAENSYRVLILGGLHANLMSTAQVIWFIRKYLTEMPSKANPSYYLTQSLTLDFFPIVNGPGYDQLDKNNNLDEFPTDTSGGTGNCPGIDPDLNFDFQFPPAQGICMGNSPGQSAITQALQEQVDKYVLIINFEDYSADNDNHYYYPNTQADGANSSLSRTISQMTDNAGRGFRTFSSDSGTLMGYAINKGVVTLQTTLPKKSQWTQANNPDDHWSESYDAYKKVLNMSVNVPQSRLLQAYSDTFNDVNYNGKATFYVDVTSYFPLDQNIQLNVTIGPNDDSGKYSLNYVPNSFENVSDPDIPIDHWFPEINNYGTIKTILSFTLRNYTTEHLQLVYKKSTEVATETSNFQYTLLITPLGNNSYFSVSTTSGVQSILPRPPEGAPRPAVLAIMLLIFVFMIGTIVYCVLLGKEPKWLFFW